MHCTLYRNACCITCSELTHAETPRAHNIYPSDTRLLLLEHEHIFVPVCPALTRTPHAHRRLAHSDRADSPFPLTSNRLHTRSSHVAPVRGRCAIMIATTTRNTCVCVSTAQVHIGTRHRRGCSLRARAHHRGNHRTRSHARVHRTIRAIACRVHHLVRPNPYLIAHILYTIYVVLHRIDVRHTHTATELPAFICCAERFSGEIPNAICVCRVRVCVPCVRMRAERARCRVICVVPAHTCGSAGRR